GARPPSATWARPGRSPARRPGATSRGSAATCGPCRRGSAGPTGAWWTRPAGWRPAGTTWPGPAGGTTATAGTTTTTTTTTTRRATPGGPTADRDHDRRAARPAGRAPGRGAHGRVRPQDRKSVG